MSKVYYVGTAVTYYEAPSGWVVELYGFRLQGAWSSREDVKVFAVKVNEAINRKETSCETPISR